MGLSYLLVFNVISPASITKAEIANTLLSNNLMAYYTFNEGSVNMGNRTVDNLASDADTYNGVLGSLANQNQTTITLGDGIEGKALHFNGTESYFRIPNVLNSNENYTISMWIKHDTTSPTEGASINILQQRNASNEGRTLLYLKNKKYGTFVSGSDLLTEKQTTYGEWQHVVVTGKKNTTQGNQLTIYENGVKVLDQSIASGILNAITDLQVGCHKNKDSGYSLKGAIDDIRIYGKEASQELVDGLFAVHGAPVLFRELTLLISQANAVIRDSSFAITDPTLVKLKTATEDAAKLTASSGFEEINRTKVALTIAMEEYSKKVLDQPTLIHINPENITRKIPDYMFGTNHRYHMDSYGTWNPNTNSLYEEFKALGEEGTFGSIRYPGGIVSNLFQWKRSIGAKEQRKKTIHGNWNEPNINPYFGVDEAAKYIVDELNSELIYVYNVGNGSAADASDLVEYLNCEVGENPNGGIDWAKVRADNGHKEPYHVKEFEIGNEVDEGRGYWLQNSPDQWSGSGLDVAKMYAEGAERKFVKEKVAEVENWNTSNDKSKASYFSNGQANQKKYMRYANDVTDQVDQSKAVKSGSVQVFVNNVEWPIVTDLSKVVATDKKVQVNYQNGEILFGDGIHGAIPDINAEIRVSYTVYKDGLADYYDAMKSVDPNIKVYSGYSNANIAQAVAQSDKAKANGGKFDGMAVHPYSRTNGQLNDTDEMFYEKIMEKIDSSVMAQINSRKQELLKYWPDGSKKLAVSEYGIFNHSGDVVQSQTHAIYIAANLMKFVDADVAYTNKHCLIDFPGGDVLGPGKQALIQAIKQGDGSYRFYGTPSLKVFNIFGNMSSTNIIETSMTNNKKFYNQVNSVHVMSSKDDNGNIYMIAINMDRNKDIPITINIENESFVGQNVKVKTLQGDSVYAINSLEKPNNVDIENTSLVATEKQLQYTLPAHSIVGFQLIQKEKPVIKEGWVEENGKKRYYRNNEVVTDEWVINSTNTTKQYADEHGYLSIGWKVIANAKYYFGSDGVMQTGLQLIDGKKYYFGSSGVMQLNWQLVANVWYYFGSNAVMQTGWQLVGGCWYYLGKDGAMQTGWQLVDSHWYYLESSGAMQTGWKLVDGRWYYLGNNGAMETGWQLLGDQWYYLNQSGTMEIGWQLIGEQWYYLGENGVMYTGWLLLDGQWYYLNDSGVMETDWQFLNQKWYYLNKSGVMQKGSVMINQQLNFFNFDTGVWNG